MKRDIVFKIWHKERKLMETSAIGVYGRLRHILNIHAESRFSSCDNKPYPNDFVALQFTGMYDATTYEELTEEQKTNFKYEYPYNKVDIDLAKEWKGIPIYEGDIVNTDINFMDEEVMPTFMSEIYYNENEGCYEVKVEHRGDICTFPIFVIGQHFKVIGNKYQHPNLLQ